MIRIDNMQDARVAGVYKDLPQNTTFRNLQFIASWDLYMAAEWPQGPNTDWNDNFMMLYAQLAPRASVASVSDKIRFVKADHLADKSMKPEMFLAPMRDWHLRSEWKGGVQTGGRVQIVWMVGTIGVFVLLLACINFMNLSTARSESRSREVGIRMAVGSVRRQLIGQFLSESFVVVALSFGVAVGCAALCIPYFNAITEKNLAMAWGNPYFWSISLVLVVFTSVVAGSYPALYLSSLRPVKVLRGTFKMGRFAALPRKVLVVFQFTVSVLLATGTLVVYKQIQYSKSRPIGYDRNGLITVQMKSPDFHGKLDVLRNTLQDKGAIVAMAQASSPVTGIWNNSNALQWPGKDPSQNENIATVMITPDYGKTIGWTIASGRDVSIAHAADSAAILLNEAAVRYMNTTDPLGMEITWGKGKFYVVGVVHDLIAGSPYEPVRPSVYIVREKRSEWMFLKLNPAKSPHESLATIESVYRQVIPSAPFDYKFVDDEYARKFAAEHKAGNLVLIFTVLAIAISCLGLFGLASFMVGQKVKEIGVRKVMGASVVSIWRLLSRDFVVLVVISCAVAIPLSIYSMRSWLSRYTYRIELSWYIFAAVGAGALLVTLATVSFQSIRAARANPVKSLRAE
jgi:ABC-type antimicrobial peptide transport system permease subunit